MRLVSRGVDARDIPGLMQRHQGGEHDDGGAVGVGDDALMLESIIWIHLGHHQGHIGIHAEGRRVIDQRRTGLEAGSGVFFGDATTDGEEGDVHPFKRAFTELLHGDILTLKGHGFTGGARTGKQAQLINRHFVRLENL